jgi:RHS repeat-associated protein
VSLPSNILTDSTDVTVELWFKAASTSSSGVLFGYASSPLTSSSPAHWDPALYIGGNGELYGEFWNGSANPIHTSYPVTDPNWHHVVLTANSSSQTMYLDGNPVYQQPLNGQINQLNMTYDTVGAGFWKGPWPSNNTPGGNQPPVGYFNGDIAQVAIYPHPIGASAITAHDTLRTVASPEMTQVTLPSGNTYEQATYDPGTGRLASYTDRNGGTWTLGQSVISSQGSSGSATLSAEQDQVTITNPSGTQATYLYDMLNGGRLVSYDNGVDGTVTYGYDAAGFLAYVLNPDYAFVCFTHDIHGNVLTRAWANAQFTPGQLGSYCAGLPATSSPTCNSTQGPCTTFYGYAPYSQDPLARTNGELTSVRDARSASNTDNTYLTSYTYDNNNGQLLTETTPATFDFPNGRTTQYVYTTGSDFAYGSSSTTTPAGLLKKRTTPGGAVTSYQYYSNGDLAEITGPLGRSTVYTYDALGRVLTSTVTTTSPPASETTTYTYDAFNRQATVTHPAVANQLTNVTHTLLDSYSYDSDGDLLSRTQSDLTGGDPSRSTTYTYNALDQVASVTQPAGVTPANPQGATTGYTYDAFGNVASMTDPNGNVFDYTYNEYNELTEVMLDDPSASQAPAQYCGTDHDPQGNIAIILKSYAYDPTGLLSQAVQGQCRFTDYGYDPFQNLISSTTGGGGMGASGSGSQTLYNRDGAANVVSNSVVALDNNGQPVGPTTVTAYSIDAADRLVSVMADQGTSGTNLNRLVSYKYDADGHVLSQTVGSGQNPSTVTNYLYDAAGDRTSQTVVDGSTNLTTTWTYDQNGELTSMTTPAGNAAGGTTSNYTTNYVYDAAWNLVTVQGPPVQTQTYTTQSPAVGRPVTTYGYDTYGDRTQALDPDFNTTTTGYDGDGRITSVLQMAYTPPGASSSITQPATYAYDENGNLAQVTDPAGNVATYTYDALGDRTSATGPLPGATWKYTYDASGDQLSATDPLQKTVRQANYNYLGEPLTSTDALNNTTTYTYDYRGGLTSVATPDNVVTTATYDDLGELTSVADAYGDTSSYQYDYAGRLSRATHPDGSYESYGYDEAGNKTSVADYTTAGSLLRSDTLGYDLNADLTSAKDWNGNTSTYTYNAAGQQTSKIQPVSSSTSLTTSYGYDPAGNLTAVTPGNQNNTTWTTYNSWNLPESVIEPATSAAPAAANRTWTTGYDADGRPVSVTQPGGITQAYTYDQLGDLTSAAGSGASAPTPTQTLGYDLDGRLTSATAPGGADTFAYYNNGELQSASGPSGASSFTYNGDGLVSGETSPGGTTAYTYDSADRLATLSEPLTGSTFTYGYNADSQPTTIGYSISGASGPRQAFTYNSLNQLASGTVTTPGGYSLGSEAYGYDANGNLTSQTTTGLVGAGTTTYTYDQANRITSATAAGTTTGYSYDGDGNLTQAGATSYLYNAQDQLTSATTSGTTTSYAYTLSGALASVIPAGGSAQNYTSDAFGNDVSVPGGIAYAYDALGRLVTRTVGSSSTSLSYLGTGNTLTFDGTRQYTYTPDGTMAATKSTTGSTNPFVAMSNLHGDLAATFSPASTVNGLAGSTAYSPYGTPTTSGYRPDIGYQGDYRDPITHLVDMGARWYNPSTGSFITNDTIAGSPLSTTIDSNPYAYTTGSPLTQTDPTGHDICPTEPTVVGGQIVLKTVCPTDTTGTGTQGQWQLPQWQKLCQVPGNCPAQQPAPCTYAGTCGVNEGPCAGMEGLTPGCGLAPPSTAPGQLPPPDSPCIDNCGPYYPPPPPPQDCYAVGLCAPPKPPGPLGLPQWITAPVTNWVNFATLCQLGRCIIENLSTQHHIKGTTYNKSENGAPNPDQGGGPNDIGELTGPITQIDEPGTPQAAGPTGSDQVTGTTKQECQPEENQASSPNPLDMVPEGASIRVLRPDPNGGAQVGIEYKWTNEQGQTVRLRIHGPDGTAPPGSNAAEGTT